MEGYLSAVYARGAPAGKQNALMSSVQAVITQMFG